RALPPALVTAARIQDRPFDSGRTRRRRYDRQLVAAKSADQTVRRGPKRIADRRVAATDSDRANDDRSGAAGDPQRLDRRVRRLSGNGLFEVNEWNRALAVMNSLFPTGNAPERVLSRNLSAESANQGRLLGRELSVDRDERIFAAILG